MINISAIYQALSAGFATGPMLLFITYVYNRIQFKVWSKHSKPKMLTLVGCGVLAVYFADVSIEHSAGRLTTVSLLETDFAFCILLLGWYKLTRTKWYLKAIMKRH